MTDVLPLFYMSYLPLSKAVTVLHPLKMTDVLPLFYMSDVNPV
jgi:hypothetical protein